MKKTTKRNPGITSSRKRQQRQPKNAKDKKRGVASNKRSGKPASKKMGAKKRSQRSGLGILKPAVRKKIELALTQLEEVLGKLEDKAIKKLS